MRSESTNSKTVLLSLEPREQVCFSNVLNEVCNGFLISNFSKRIGISRREVNSLREIVKKSSSPANTRLELTRNQLLAIRNSITESMKELGIEEFHTRVGISLRDGEHIGQEIDRVLRSTGPAGSEGG